MNNETKRDVFKIIADKCTGYDYELYNQYLNQYDDALPDNLPVIPDYVAEYINYMKSSGRDIWDAIHYPLRSNNIGEYMEDNSETFARAWLLGVWRAKETGEIVKLEEIDDGD